MIKALLGPNGAGKSTYLRKLMGIETNQVDRGMAMVFQEPLLFDLTVFENIALGPKFRKDEKICGKVEFWLKKFGIDGLRNRRAITLSGGEAQKVSLARALILEPKTLLLDEPFANLDSSSQIRLRDELKIIIKENQIETIWITHNKQEALTVADYLMIMLNYQIVQEGLPEEVLRKPKTKEIADFLGIENIFHGGIEKKDNRRFFKNSRICFEVADKEYQSVWAIIHPEDIILSKEKLLGTSARNCLAGAVLEVVRIGLTYRIKIDAGEIFYVNITRVSKEELEIEKGEKVFLTFKATAVEII